MMSQLVRILTFTLALPLAVIYWPTACANHVASSTTQAPDSQSAAGAETVGFSGLLPHPPFAHARAGEAGDVSIADIAEKTTPSVVSVMSERIAEAPPQIPFFFGPSQPDGRGHKQQGFGSGVIVSEDGIVLTNHHVVEEATKVKITLSDDREFDAEVVGTDSKSDLAVLRILGKPSGLQPIAFGDSSNLRLGDVVLAIGNPFGVGQTVTMGIVSAKGRADMGIVDYEDFIQTDAAINPGNSGGALVNMRGELVGVNTAILSRSGGYQGIGFAIPSNMARPIMTSLQTDGRVSRGFLGVGIQDLTPDIASAMGLDNAHGVLITDVQPDGAAQRAGVKRGDVVLEVDGKPVNSTGKMRNLIAATGANKPVMLTLQRGDKQIQLNVVLEELPGEVAAGPGSAGSAPTSSTLGMQLTPLTPELAQRLRLDPAETKGKVVISGVEGGSPSAEAGLRAGDLLLEVNRTKVTRAAQAAKLLRTAKGTVLLLVQRDGASRFVALKR